MNKESDSDNQVWTISGLIKWTSEYFEAREIDNPRMAAELLLSHCLGLTRLDLYLQHDKPMLQKELALFKTLIKRRVTREPVAYITGVKGFWSLDLAVSADVLIPRPDTECLVETALSVISENFQQGPLKIADLGTGSGAVVLALAASLPENYYCAVDISPAALCIAKKNATFNCPDANINFIAGSWLDAFSEEEIFDVIVSNPPYIPTKDILDLQAEVRMYEPALALDGDADGLKCIRHIVKNAHNFLKPGGWLMLEIAFDQKKDVLEIVAGTGCYAKTEFLKDFAGNDRVVKMQKINC